MKIIQSDKTGRRIHSPFIYRLVSNTIFAPYPFYSFSEIDKITNSVAESEELKIVFRLVNFFRFKQIFYNGEKDANLERVCKLSKSDISILNSQVLPELTKENDCNGYYRLVLVDYKISKEYLKSIPERKEIWIIRNFKTPENLKLFSMLKSHQNVQITLKLKLAGIVIFNKNFEKQDYVIK